MHTKNALIKTIFVVITILTLAACATQPSPAATSTPAAAATSAPVAAGTPSAVSLAATATLAQASANQTYSIKPDDQTQARLRIGQCILNGPNVDIYINGNTTENGGVPYNLRSFDFSGYLYLPPGQVNLAVAPSGAGLDKALFTPLDLTLEAGHRYTLVVMGQEGDNQHKTLLIDETAVMKEAGTTADRTVGIWINNIQGVAAFDHILNGAITASEVPYGGYKVEILPPPPLEYKTDIVTVSGAPDQILDSGSSWTLDQGNVDSILCWAGKYPGTEGTDYGSTGSAIFTNLSLLDYLKRSTELDQSLNDPSRSYNDFLALVKAAGMADLLNNSPHLVFVPTDQAFSVNLPKAKLDALLADPSAAQALLKEHIIDGYYPYGSLSNGGGTSDRTLTAMSGRSLKLLGNPLQINGNIVGNDQPFFTANGSRFTPINVVLQSP